MTIRRGFPDTDTRKPLKIKRSPARVTVSLLALPASVVNSQNSGHCRHFVTPNVSPGPIRRHPATVGIPAERDRYFTLHGFLACLTRRRTARLATFAANRRHVIAVTRDGYPAFPSRFACFTCRPFMRGAFFMSGPPALARDLALTRGIH